MFTLVVVSFSNPKYCQPKYIKKSTIYVLIAVSILGLIFTILDILINFDISKSVYMIGSFDFRGDLNNSAFKFAASSLSELSIPAYVITRNYGYKFFSRIFFLWIIINILFSLTAPSKALVLNFLSIALDWLFWLKVLSSKGVYFKPIISTNMLLVSKRFFKQLISLSTTVLIIIISTLIAINYLLGLDFSQSLLKEYEASNLPPFSSVAILRASSPKKSNNVNFLNKARKYLEENTNCECIGPLPDIVSKVRGNFRHSLLLKAQTMPTLHKNTQNLVERHIDKQKRLDVRWSVDLNPIDYQ